MFASAVSLFLLVSSSLVSAQLGTPDLATSFKPRQLTSALMSVTGLSAECQGALLNVLGNNAAATCLNLPSIISVATTVPGSSVIHPVDQWLDGLCAAGTCDDPTLAGVVTNVTSGCASDFQGGEALIISLLQGSYSTLRNMVCLTDTTTTTLCITELFTAIQSFLGQPLTLSNFGSLIAQIILQLGSVPSNVLCTNCLQAAFSILQSTSIFSSVPFVSQAVSSVCGASFASNASPPSDIIEGIGAAAPSPSPLTLDSGAPSSFVPAHMMTLLALSSVIFIFVF